MVCTVFFRWYMPAGRLEPGESLNVSFSCFFPFTCHIVTVTVEVIHSQKLVMVIAILLEVLPDFMSSQEYNTKAV